VTRWIRAHTTYANVTATVALFIAVGGSSYAAITLPRNSVGERQIKPRAIGPSEMKSGAIGTRALKNRSIRRRDLSRETTNALKGPAGPAGPPGPAAAELRAAVNASGTVLGGNATEVTTQAVGLRIVRFSRGLAGCVPVAALALSPGEDSNPAGGSVVATLSGDLVSVTTYDASGTPAQLAFNLIVTC
jgi:hypothetical protein